jgi:hypothetical protein
VSLLLAGGGVQRRGAIRGREKVDTRIPPRRRGSTGHRFLLSLYRQVMINASEIVAMQRLRADSCSGDSCVAATGVMIAHATSA